MIVYEEVKMRPKEPVIPLDREGVKSAKPPSHKYSELQSCRMMVQRVYWCSSVIPIARTDKAELASAIDNLTTICAHFLKGVLRVRNKEFERLNL